MHRTSHKLYLRSYSESVETINKQSMGPWAPSSHMSENNKRKMKKKKVYIPKPRKKTRAKNKTLSEEHNSCWLNTRMGLTSILFPKEIL